MGLFSSFKIHSDLKKFEIKIIHKQMAFYTHKVVEQSISHTQLLCSLTVL